MPFEKCKVYSDGSHYIAIPHTTRPYRPRPQRKEEVIPVQASPPQEYEPRTDVFPVRLVPEYAVIIAPQCPQKRCVVSR